MKKIILWCFRKILDIQENGGKDLYTMKINI